MIESLSGYLGSKTQLWSFSGVMWEGEFKEVLGGKMYFGSTLEEKNGEVLLSCIKGGSKSGRLYNNG